MAKGKKSGEAKVRKVDEFCLSKVIDGLVYSACCGDDGGEVGMVYRRRYENVCHEALSKAVDSGVNPFYVSLKPLGGVGKGGGVKSKSRRKRNMGLKGGDAVSLLCGMKKTTVKDMAGSVVPFRVPTGSKVFAMCRGNTKADSLFKLFRTYGLAVGSSRVRVRRNRALRKEEGSLGCSNFTSKCEELHVAFWHAVALIIKQRDLYKKKIFEVLRDQPNEGGGVPHVPLLLRSFPLFGLIVEVQELSWGLPRCLRDRRPEVTKSSMGIVVHESGDFVGVLLLGSHDSLSSCLKALRNTDDELISEVCGPQVEQCTRINFISVSETLPTGRVMNVAKVCPKGLGPVAAYEVIDMHGSGEAVVARVAPDEVKDVNCPFKELVGHFL